VKARIPNADNRLRPGLFARTDLGISKRSGAVFVPVEAVLQRADGEVLFVVGADERVKRVVVKTGAERDGRIEITEGLAGDAAVVVRGHTALVDGVLVARKDEDAAPLAAPPGASLASDAAAGGSAR